MTKLEEMINAAESVVILGHINPDGDCAGSCLAVYNYVQKMKDGIPVKLYLQPVAEKFSYLSGYDQIEHEPESVVSFDLCICVDASDRERLGEFAVCLDQAKNSICIDHHVTNPGYAQVNIIEAEASSSAEVLYTQLDEEKIDKAIAECIYTGIIHDTGVFRYSCTSSRTMEIAGKLMSKGIDFTRIIDESFFRKTYHQSQILGRALMESVRFFHNQCIFTVVRKQDMTFYGVDHKDLDGIVDQLKIIDGVECAIFLYETGNHVFKVSMRSNNYVDVSKIAAYFGGGGHVRAAGCTMSGSIHDVVNNLSEHIEKQLGQVTPDA